MSSGNPSVNSPASPASYHEPRVLVDLSGQLIDDNGEPIPGMRIDVEDTNEDAPLPILPRPDALEFLRAPPLSPRSALLMLQSQGTGGTLETYREVAQGLANTVITRSAQFEALQRDQAAAMDQERQRLIAAAGVNVRRLPAVPEVADASSDEDLPTYQAVSRAPALDVAAEHRPRERFPSGYMRNHNHVPGFLIPAAIQRRSATTAFVEAPFIRRSTRDPLVVEGTTNGILVYAAPLYATPREPDRPVDSLPPWLLSLLHCSSPHYSLLIQHSNREGDWGLGGELARYHMFSEQISRVRDHLDRWETELETLQAGRDQSRFRLEQARAGERLQALERLADPSYGYRAEAYQTLPIPGGDSYRPTTNSRCGGTRRGRGRPSR